MTPTSRWALALLLLCAAPAVAQGALTVPGEATGELTTSDPTVPLTLAGDLRPADRYTLTLAAGEAATVRMQSTAFDTYLKVMRDGAFHARNDDYEGRRDVSQVVLTQPGDYVVYAGSFTELAAGGRYAIAVLPSASRAPTASALGTAPARALALPSTLEGRLTTATERVPLTRAGDMRPADRYTLTLAAGQEATVQMRSAPLDTYLKVFRNGELYDRNDDYGGSRDLSQVRLSAPGEYLILAGSFGAAPGSGAYTVSAALAGAAPVAQDSVLAAVPTGGDGGRTTGTLTNDSRELPLLSEGGVRKADTYAVELRAGEVLVVVMTSNVFDTFLAVSREGSIVARNDDDGSTARSRIRYVAPEDGRYLIHAGAYAEAGRGRYDFAWGVE